MFAIKIYGRYFFLTIIFIVGICNGMSHTMPEQKKEEKQVSQKYKEQEQKQILFDCLVALEHGFLDDIENTIRIRYSKKDYAVPSQELFDILIQKFLSDDEERNNFSLAVIDRIQKSLPSKNFIFFMILYGSYPERIISAIFYRYHIDKVLGKDFQAFYKISLTRTKDMSKDLLQARTKTLGEVIHNLAKIARERMNKNIRCPIKQTYISLDCVQFLDSLARCCAAFACANSAANSA